MSVTPPTPAARDADVPLDVELLLSTHHAVVVRVRTLDAAVGPADGAGHDEHGLVVPRRHCEGGRPRKAALLRAARDFANQLACSQQPASRPQRLLARIGGRWNDLLGPTPGAARA